MGLYDHVRDVVRWRPEMPYDMELLSRAITGAAQLGMRSRGVSYSG